MRTYTDTKKPIINLYMTYTLYTDTQHELFFFVCSRISLLVLVLFCCWQAVHLHNLLACNWLDFRDEHILHVQGLNVISSTDTESINHDIWNGATACDFAHKLLDLRSKGVLVEFNNIRSRHNGVLAKNVLCFLAEGAVWFRENDN